MLKLSLKLFDLVFFALLSFFSFFSLPSYAEFSNGVGDVSTCSKSGWMYYGRTGCVTGTACNNYSGSSGLPDPKDVICISSSFDPSNYTPLNSTCTNTASGRVCTCNVNTRENRSVGLLYITTSCDVTYAEPSSDILGYAFGAGLIAGGLSGAFATCSIGINPACVASAALAVQGAGLALATYLNDGSSAPSFTSTDPCANKTCVTVQLDPNKPLTSSSSPQVTRDSDGNFNVAGDGWTNNGDGTQSHTSTHSDGSTTSTVVDTTSDRVTSTTTYSDGDVMSSVIQSGNEGGGVYTISQSTDSTGSNVHQTSNYYNDSGVLQTSETRQQGSNVSGTPYNWSNGIGIGGGGTGGGDTGGVDTGGGGTGGGDTGGGGDCFEYGCATEATLQDIKDELLNTRYDEALLVKDDLNNLADNGINEAADRMGAMLDDAITELGLDALFNDVTDNLPIQQLIETNASNCSYGFSLLGNSYELSICDYQDTIHAVLAFLFFIALSFGIFSLIFERPSGG